MVVVKKLKIIKTHINRFILILLLIEFVDELVGGVREAAWPLLRSDLNLDYFQIGMLISLPGIIGSFIEPLIGILGDVWKRRVLILGGGVIFTLSTVLAAASNGFWPLLIAYICFYPASGAYVSLSQAVLMDLDTDRHEQNMARWTFAGSIGVVGGPLIIGGAVMLGGGWREPFWGVAVLAALTLAGSWAAYQRVTLAQDRNLEQGSSMVHNLLKGLRFAFQALKRKDVLRWLVLLEFADLVLDIFYSFIALYLVDVAGFSMPEAGLGLAIWTGVGLLGDFLIIPLLDRVPGLVYLRVSAVLKLLIFPALLLVPNPVVKLVLLGLFGFLNAGWYSILMGRLYSSMPGQSGTVMTLGNVVGLFGRMLPLGIGLLAQLFGLQYAMWVILLGPVALLVGLPRDPR